MKKDKRIKGIVIGVLVVCGICFTHEAVVTTMERNLYSNGSAEHATTDQDYIVKEELYDAEDIEVIKTDLGSADLEVTIYEGDKIKVIAYAKDGKHNDLYNIEVNDNTLNIGKKEQIGFTTWDMQSYAKVELFIPQSYKEEVYLQTSSGNIIPRSDMKMEKITMKTSSGDIENKYKVAGEKVKIALSSGKGTLQIVEAEEYKLKSSLGSIEVMELIGEGDINTASGKINVKVFKGAGKIATASGDILIGMQKLIDDLKITTTSGTVEISNDANLSAVIDVASSSGNILIDGKRKEDKALTCNWGTKEESEITIKTSSGSVKINNNSTNGGN